MRLDLYTKIVLAVVAVLLAAIAGEVNLPCVTHAAGPLDGVQFIPTTKILQDSLP
jgi:hypothetical protein